MSVWVDGVPSEDASISVLDQTFLRGDGCFEALRSYQGRLFDPAGHLDRLERSAAALHLELPARADLHRWLAHAADVSGDAVIRLVITRGASDGHGHAVVLSESLPERPRGYRLVTVEAPWHPAGRSWELTGVKSVSYAPNMAASRRARRAGADDALLVSDGLLLEGPTFSVGWVADGVLETPSLELGILESVTRRHVLELAAEMNVPCRRGRWPKERLDAASEAMVWSTIKEVSPVAAVDDRVFESGPVTERLAAAFEGRIQSMR